MRKLFLILIFFSFNLNAQDYFIVNDGVKTKDYQYNVFKNANIHSSNGMISNGTLIEKDGKIIQIGVNLNPAKILGIENEFGTLEVGKSATLFISKGDALDIISNNVTHAFISGRNISLETHQTRLWRRYSNKYSNSQ